MLLASLLSTTARAGDQPAQVADSAGEERLMPSVSRIVFALLSATALTSACAADQPPSGATDPVPPTMTPSQLPERVPEPERPPPVVGEVPADLMAKLRADLAKQAGAGASDARVIRAESVVWPDGGLGCPRPGEIYTQAPEPGYWVEFELATRVYSYHATRKGFFKLCPTTPVHSPRAAPPDRN